MDPAGNTIASSNRYESDSFVGKNFDFRPYFQQAIRGQPSTYLALGTTSGRRGAYFSHPILVKEQKAPIGIVVIKASIEQIEKELVTGNDEVVLVTGPPGIVFISNRRSLLYHSLRRLSAAQLTEVDQSLQFGQGPWNWTGFELRDEGYVVDGAGNEFMMNQSGLDNYPEWQVLYLRNLQSISKTVLDPLIKISGPLILTLCALIGISVFLLYRKASVEIFKRLSAEKALRKSEERSAIARELHDELGQMLTA
jgi:C4-dicarboxylate-specific signal transduction histidine kinase